MFENTIDKDQKNKIIWILMRIFSNGEVKKESAVSPVVGIMLMITITLILAAIISGMTGGIAQSQKKPPSLLIDASLINGTHDSLDIGIISVSEAIPTRDVKLITEWRNNGVLERKIIDTGSNKIKDANNNEWRYPVGITTNTTSTILSNFSEYSLIPGTRMFANTSDSIKEMFSSIPPSGSVVKIQFVHIPSGAIIAQKELTVQES